MKVFISRLYLNYSRRNSRFSCPDFFPALRRSFARDCMGTSVILRIFSQTRYSLQNQIFLTVSNNCLILNRKIQGGIRQTWIFRIPLGGSPVLITWQTMSVDSYFDWLIPRFYPTISRNFLSNQKVRGLKSMRVFISRLYLI